MKTIPQIEETKIEIKPNRTETEMLVNKVLPITVLPKNFIHRLHFLPLTQLKTIHYAVNKIKIDFEGGKLIPVKSGIKKKHSPVFISSCEDF